MKQKADYLAMQSFQNNEYISSHETLNDKTQNDPQQAKLQSDDGQTSALKHTSNTSSVRLNEFIQDYKLKQQQKEASDRNDYGSNLPNTIDSYIHVLTFLHKTKRFEKFFDPMRLKMMLIKPAKIDAADYLESNKTQIENYPSAFLAGCHLYQLANYTSSA